MRRDLIVLPRKMRKDEYDNYRMTQDVITAIFKNSVNQPISEVPMHVPSISTDKIMFACLGEGILEQLEGSKALATAVALYGNPTEQQLMEIVNIIVKEDYSPEKGYDFCWFNNFCRPASHWLNIVTALERKKFVTVLVNHSKKGRMFTNIVGYSNALNPSNNPRHYNSFKLMGIKEWIELEELCDMLETAPWIWNV